MSTQINLQGAFQVTALKFSTRCMLWIAYAAAQCVERAMFNAEPKV